MDFQPYWSKLLKLEAQSVESVGASISRQQIKEHFKISEFNARSLYEALQNRHIISSGDSGIKHDVVMGEKVKSQNREIVKAKREIKRLVRKVELLADIKNQRIDVPKMLMPPAPKKGESIASIILSDLHCDEFVNPPEIGWVNGYGREIADARLEKFTRSAIKIGRDYINGIKIKGLVVNLAGDIVSGMIHDELRETNCYPMADTIIHYTKKIASCLSALLEYYKDVFVVCVPGNHGRFDQKVKHKGAVKDNWDFLLYNLIADKFAGVKGIRFYIPVSPDAIYPIYNTRFCVSHGNQFRGGSGWMGALGPVMKGDRKKREKQAAVNNAYDILLCGHFHTLQFLNGCIMNGSMIGYNEFASNGNFPFEEPQQAFWLTDPNKGVTFKYPIHCKCKNESWEQQQEVVNGF